MKKLTAEIAITGYLLGAIGTAMILQQADPKMPIIGVTFLAATWPVTWLAIATAEPQGGF